jgi:hypothetical protein
LSKYAHRCWPSQDLDKADLHSYSEQGLDWVEAAVRGAGVTACRKFTCAQTMLCMIDLSPQMRGLGEYSPHTTTTEESMDWPAKR